MHERGGESRSFLLHLFLPVWASVFSPFRRPCGYNQPRAFRLRSALFRAVIPWKRRNHQTSGHCAADVEKITNAQDLRWQSFTSVTVSRVIYADGPVTTTSFRKPSRGVGVKVVVCQKNSPELSMILLHGGTPDAHMRRAWAIYANAVCVSVVMFRA